MHWNTLRTALEVRLAAINIVFRVSTSKLLVVCMDDFFYRKKKKGDQYFYLRIKQIINPEKDNEYCQKQK